MDPMSSDAANGVMAAMAGVMAVAAIVGIFFIICMWKIYAKAGKPGWAAIIPIYNIIVQLEIINRPVWWLVLLFIPFVNIVIMIIMTIDMAKSFGRSTGFGIGLLFLSIIFYPILAFGSSTYTKIERPA